MKTGTYLFTILFYIYTTVPFRDFLISAIYCFPWTVWSNFLLAGEGLRGHQEEKM